MEFAKEDKLRNIIKKYSLPYSDSFTGRSLAELEKGAKKLSYPLVLKIVSSKIIHKSDAGGVITNIKNADDLKAAFAALSGNKALKGKIDSYLLQKQYSGHEIIIGCKKDVVFGQTILFGLGGIFVEAFEDVSLRIAPVSQRDAEEMVEEIKFVKILKGLRGKKPANIKAIVSLISRISEMCLKEDIEEMDLNPVIVDEKRAVIVDMRVAFSDKKKEKDKSKSCASLLDTALNPKSIAIVGASRDENSVGHGILKSLVTGGVLQSRYCRSFRGKIFPINPKADYILNLKCYASVKEIKEDIDIAVIAVPAKIVPSVMKECIDRKVKVCVVISAGFSEVGEDGRKLQNEILDIANKSNIALIGPNCLGVIRPFKSLNASFAPTMPPAGNVAFVTQSGALADSIIDWSVEQRYGFSSLISIGNRAQLDIPDYLEWLDKDPETKAIAIYSEGISDGKRFIEVASKVGVKKPIVILKAGKSVVGTRAVSSHTGNLAGEYRVYEAAFKKAGVHVARNIEELFDLAKTLANLPKCRENAVAIVTNGGGAGVLCADHCEKYGVNLVQLKKSTIEKLDASGKMHPAYSRANPLDIVGDALPDRYQAAVEILLNEDYISGLIVIQTLQTMTNPEEDAKIVVEARKRYRNKPIICAYMGGLFSHKSRDVLEFNGIPDFNEVEKAARAMKSLIDKK